MATPMRCTVIIPPCIFYPRRRFAGMDEEWVSGLESLRDPAVGYAEAFDLREHPLDCGPGIRALCEANACGMYGRSWTCPPASPKVGYCVMRVRQYPRMLLFRTSLPRKDAFDLDGMHAGIRDNRRVSLALRDELRGLGMGDALVLSAGSCQLCPECPYPDEPCRHPDSALPSIESYCVDIEGFLLREGIDRGSERGTRHVFFGMALYSTRPRGPPGRRKTASGAGGFVRHPTPASEDCHARVQGNIYRTRI